ncbi:hypothetical protein GGR54DRAFT_259842 [Hypoxylon sp. NC1633]|nr:hypothetical protein GGR54DRAFT_259842 [Hypoxylon sp. NC1633]
MSFFTGTTKLVNASPIPSTVSKEAAVALLHDHAFFLQCDPHYVSHRALPQTLPANTENDAETVADRVAAARREYQLPATLEPLGEPAVKLYEVVDHLPNPVWSSSVVSKEEFVDVADGLWVRIRSPLAVVMETRWFVRERKGGDGEGLGLELVEDLDISCSKLLLGIVKAQVVGNWEGIHKKLIGKMVEDVKEG